MSLSAEWFKKRDLFISQQKGLGSLSLTEALIELNLELSYFFDLGVVTQREFSTATTNNTKLTSLGSLFFIEQYQQIFISRIMLDKLKTALINWDNFTIEHELAEDNLKGTLSIRNQKHVKFQVNSKRFEHHRLSFRIKDIGDELSVLFNDDQSYDVKSIWEDFCQSVSLIENENKQPSNLEIATDDATIETLCAPWHKLVQRYFRSRMHQIGFEINFTALKKDIEHTYAVQESNWVSINELFESLSHSRVHIDEEPSNLDAETQVELLNYNSINEYSLVEPERIEYVTRKIRHIRSYRTVIPGDVLLYKNNIEKKVQVAYYPIENTKDFPCSEFFTVLRAKNSSCWAGKQLYLFLLSGSGEKLLEYVFRDFSVAEIAQPRITSNKLRMLKIPLLTSEQATKLNKKYENLRGLINQKTDIDNQICSLIRKN